MTSSEMSLKEFAKQATQPPDQHAVWNKCVWTARQLWKRLVENVGEPKAKEIMRLVMGEGKPGPRLTDEDIAMTGFIYSYIRREQNQTDRKIAKHLFESNPYYLYYESGAVAIANNEITETYMSLDGDPIVERKPIEKSLSAIQKRVERIRRWAIKENILPKDYSPRAYSR